LIDHLPDSNVLRLLGQNGEVCLSIEVTPAGPLLRFDGGLLLEATGGLAVCAQQVAIHGREGVAISSGGDARIDVAGDLETQARIQNITAVLGNVNVKANDDVKLNGERVMVNC
jgi:hypothetical protein